MADIDKSDVERASKRVARISAELNRRLATEHGPCSDDEGTDERGD